MAFGQNAIPVASGIVLFFLVVTSWVTFDRVGQVLDAKDLVSHTLEVRAKLAEIYGLVAKAESDQRAYLLTLNQERKGRYLSSQNEVRALVKQTRRLTADNPKQASRLDRLETAVEERYRALGETVEARERFGIDAAIGIVKEGRGFQAMTTLRETMQLLTAEEERLLSDRVKASERQVVEAEISFGLSLLVSVGLIATFGVLSQKLVSQREQAAEEERSLRTEVEKEVARTKAAEARLERTMRELERSNEELQNFAFVASHDLQEPLRKIRAFSDRVRRRSASVLDDESKDSLGRVEAAADRMQRLILDLLELSRITTKVRPHVRIDLGQAISEVADDLQTRIEETDGKIVYESLPVVVADPAQIRQLFQNLLANALKFRREGVPPVVRVSALTRKDGRIAVKIEDNGIGFEEKFADRIFVVFQRLHGRGEYEGSGIGLAIVRKIVERHGGTIQAKGTLGKGSAFLFDLPGETSAPASDGIVNAEDAQ